MDSKPIDEMSYDELKAEVESKGLTPESKKKDALIKALKDAEGSNNEPPAPPSGDEPNTTVAKIEEDIQNRLDAIAKKEAELKAREETIKAKEAGLKARESLADKKALNITVVNNPVNTDKLRPALTRQKKVLADGTVMIY